MRKRKRGADRGGRTTEWPWLSREVDDDPGVKIHIRVFPGKVRVLLEHDALELGEGLGQREDRVGTKQVGRLLFELVPVIERVEATLGNEHTRQLGEALVAVE